MPRRTRRPCRPCAFTLVEFLVALFLLLVIVAGGMLLLAGVSKAWFHGEALVSTHTEARAMAGFLNRYLAGAVIAADWPGARPEFVGTTDELVFCTLAPGVQARTDFARVRLTFDPDAGTLRVILNRLGAPDRDFVPPAGRGAQPVSFSVRSFAFSYFDGREFLASWDSRAGAAQADTLPVAVRVEFELAGPRARRGRRPVEHFDGLFEIKTAPGLSPPRRGEGG